MRTLRFTLLLFFLVSTRLPLAAQTQPPALSPPPQVIHDEDGGVRDTMESIVIPPMAQAPFTTMLQTEWVRQLYTGGTITMVNERRIARDSSGRVYQERWLLVPKNGKMQSRMSAIQISDPVKHMLATCMMDERKVCDITLYTPSNTTVFKFEGPQTGPLPNDAVSPRMRTWHADDRRTRDYRDARQHHLQSGRVR